MFDWSLLLSSPYAQAMVLLALLLILTALSGLRESLLMSVGVSLSIIWLLISAVGGALMYSPWPYLAHLGLALVLFYVLWVALIYLVGRFGQPYLGEGAMIIVFPAMAFVPIVILALIIKWIAWLF